MTTKPAKTIEEQLNILKSKGLTINNDNIAKNILFSVNYYVLSGYLFSFKNADGSYDNIDFNKLHKIYQCDKRLKSIILYAIEIIDHNLKTKAAYYMATKTSPLSYMHYAYFVNKEEHEKMLRHFTYNVHNNNRIPFVQHHITKYNGDFPIWVAMELFTLGMFWNFYSNLKTPYKKAIAQYYDTGIVQLQSWIECISYIRNLSAHNMRLYNFNTQKTPKHCKRHFHDFTQSNKIYDIVYVMQVLVPDEKEWNNYILPNLKSIFDEYEPFVKLSDYGFPDNWEKALKITDKTRGKRKKKNKKFNDAGIECK